MATNTSKQTHTAPATPTDQVTADGPTRRARRPDPVPEQQPWRSNADAKGWRTVYRGDGQPRPVASSVVVELTADQDEWLDDAAAAAGLTLHEFIGDLIENARRADLARQSDQPRQLGAGSATGN
jgi:hypothetical protein